MCVSASDTWASSVKRVYRNSHCNEENGGQLLSTFQSQPDSLTPIQLLRTTAEKYPSHKCTGQRDVDGRYQWISYSDFYKQVLSLGGGLRFLNLKRGERIGLFGRNSRYWIMLAFAAWSIGLVVVPVSDTLCANAVLTVLGSCGAHVVCCSAGKYKAICCVSSLLPTLQRVILMRDHPMDDNSLDTQTIQDLLAFGFTASEVDFPDPDDPALISYTTATGTPKGCVLTAANLVAGAAAFGTMNASITTSDVHLSFLPLAHIWALEIELLMYAQGACVGFARGDPKHVVDDILALQPTVLVGVPRFFSRIYDAMRGAVGSLLCTPAFRRQRAAAGENWPLSLVLGAVLARFRSAAECGSLLSSAHRSRWVSSSSSARL
jgi:long-chain acyl-CoA synthetase